MSEQRYQAVLAVVEDGLSVTDVAAKVGVSRQTLHAWLARYGGGGLEALADRSHRPASCPHQMDAAVEVRLVELRGLLPGWGADRLRFRLAKEGSTRCRPEPVSGGRCCGWVLVRPGRRRPAKRTYRRRERGRPMEL